MCLVDIEDLRDGDQGIEESRGEGIHVVLDVRTRPIPEIDRPLPAMHPALAGDTG